MLYIMPLCFQRTTCLYPLPLASANWHEMAQLQEDFIPRQACPNRLYFGAKAPHESGTAFYPSAKADGNGQEILLCEYKKKALTKGLFKNALRKNIISFCVL
jgi:hypothetical protein